MSDEPGDFHSMPDVMLVRELFPFCFTLDGDFRIRMAGSRWESFAPEVRTGAAFDEVFVIERPSGVSGEASIVAAFDKIRNHFDVSRMAQAGAVAALADQDYLREVLGRPEHGHWRIAPRDRTCRTTRRYLPRTAVLETSPPSSPVMPSRCAPPSTLTRM